MTGVQNSLNMLMDLFKFLLVIFVPETPDFWILIIISFLFICFGGMSFANYALFKSGHFENLTKYSERKKNENKKEHNVESEGSAQITWTFKTPLLFYGYIIKTYAQCECRECILNVSLTNMWRKIIFFGIIKIPQDIRFFLSQEMYLSFSLKLEIYFCFLYSIF